MKRFSFLFLFVILTACASPYSQPYAPQVAAPHLTQKALVTSAAELPLRQWKTTHAPSAVIVGLHGFNDYSRAFAIPARYLNRHDIAVYAYDQRGFGSAPSVGVWPGEENLVRDAANMITAVHARYPHTPVYLLGESMGGAVAVAAVTHKDFPHIDGLILSAPALWGGETMNPFYRMSLWLAAHTVPEKKLTGEDLHILASDNIDMLRALGSDPLVLKATRVDAIYGLVQLMDTAYNNIGKVKVPMLILYGAHDEVIPPEPIANGIHRAAPGTKAAYYPLGYHMLLRDLHGDVPLHDIVAWIKDKQAPLPSGNDKNIGSNLKYTDIKYCPYNHPVCE